MKPDSAAQGEASATAPAARPARLDLIERAHLKEARDTSHVMYRYEPEAGLQALVHRYWIPVWSVPAGQEAPQRVLQYPVCLLVVAPDYARFYGVVSGLSTTRLTGDGWAAGVMLAPAAGHLLARGSVAAYTDRHVEICEVLGGAGEQLVAQVRAAMAPDPHAAPAHQAAMAAYAATLRGFLPVDREGELVNELVAYVEDNPEVLRVAQLCDAFGLSERSLQRLVHRRLGLTPKWLIQRRRLQEAAERLRHCSTARTGPTVPRHDPGGRGGTTMADVAALLGYADQAHFTRDFARVTTMTPGQFAARHG